MQPAQAIEVANAANRNAGRLARASRICIEDGISGVGCSLAILGQEELGKAFYMQAFALGLLSGPDHPKKQVFLTHWLKQGLAVLVWITELAASELLPKHLALAGQDLDRKLGIEELSDVMVSLQAQLGDDMKRWGDGNSELVEVVQLRAEAAETRKIDDLKQRGLYVDVECGDPSTTGPLSIDKQTAHGELEILEKAIQLIDARPGITVEELPSFRELFRRLGLADALMNASKKPS